MRRCDTYFCQQKKRMNDDQRVFLLMAKMEVVPENTETHTFRWYSASYKPGHFIRLYVGFQ